MTYVRYYELSNFSFSSCLLMLGQGESYLSGDLEPLLQYFVNALAASWRIINHKSGCFHHKFGSDIQESKQLPLKIRLKPKPLIILFPLPTFCFHYPRLKCSPSVVFYRHWTRATSAHLFVLLGSLHAHTERLGAFIASGAG